MSFAGRDKKSSKRAIFACLAVISTLVCLLPQARAERLDDLAPWSYVSDFANALRSETREQLTKLCVEMDDRTQTQIAVVTIHSLDGAALAPFATEMYARWGIGYPPRNRGILVLMVTNDHKYRVEVGSGLASILTASKLATFDHQAMSLIEQGDYNRATLYITGEAARIVGAEGHVALASQPNVELPQPASVLGSPVTLAVVVLLVLMIVGLSALFMARRTARRGGLQPAGSGRVQQAVGAPGRTSGGFGAGGGFSGFGGDVPGGGPSGSS